MKWRPALLRFGVRFVICLVILGIAYILIFGLKHIVRPPLSITQKLTALRTSLTQGYIYGNSLTNFNQNDSVAYFTLSSVESQFKANITTTQSALSAASTKISANERATVQKIIRDQQQAANDFQSRYSILSLVIAYDPSTDLGNLDISKDAVQLTQRAKAAQAALTKVAANTSPASNNNTLSIQGSSVPSLITDSTRQAMQAEAACFATIVTQLAAQQTKDAAVTRDTCLNSYGSVRKTAIQNITQGSFTPSYQDYMKQQIPPLLSTLDKLAR